MYDWIINIDNLPTLDLHDECGDISRVLVNDFLRDNIKLKNKYIVIVHGNGNGIIRNVTHEVLKDNKYVLEYKICIYNSGATIVRLNTL